MAELVTGIKEEDMTGEETPRTTCPGGFDYAGHVCDERPGCPDGYPRLTAAGWDTGMTGDEMMRLTPRETRQLEEALDAPRERYFADEMNGYFADKFGFLDPDKAAQHACIVQGGFSTPLREAGRMIADGGAGADRARAWLADKGCTEADTER